MDDTIELAPFVRGSGFEYWNRYAAVNDEFIPIHMYDEAGREAGYPTAFGMGNLTWSYIHLAIHSWFGDAAVIEQVNAQFRNAVIRGSVLTVSGHIESTEARDGTGGVHTLSITVENQDGELIAPVVARVQVPSHARASGRDGARA